MDGTIHACYQTDLKRIAAEFSDELGVDLRDRELTKTILEKIKHEIISILKCSRVLPMDEDSSIIPRSSWNCETDEDEDVPQDTTSTIQGRDRTNKQGRWTRRSTSPVPPDDSDTAYLCKLILRFRNTYPISMLLY